MQNLVLQFEPAWLESINRHTIYYTADRPAWLESINRHTIYYTADRPAWLESINRHTSYYTADRPARNDVADRSARDLKLSIPSKDAFLFYAKPCTAVRTCLA